MDRDERARVTTLLPQMKNNLRLSINVPSYAVHVNGGQFRQRLTNGSASHLRDDFRRHPDTGLAPTAGSLNVQDFACYCSLRRFYTKTILKNLIIQVYYF